MFSTLSTKIMLSWILEVIFWAHQNCAIQNRKLILSNQNVYFRRYTKRVFLNFLPFSAKVWRIVAVAQLFQQWAESAKSFTCADPPSTMIRRANSGVRFGSNPSADFVYQRRKDGRRRSAKFGSHSSFQYPRRVCTPKSKVVLSISGIFVLYCFCCCFAACCGFVRLRSLALCVNCS